MVGEGTLPYGPMRIVVRQCPAGTGVQSVAANGYGGGVAIGPPDHYGGRVLVIRGTNSTLFPAQHLRIGLECAAKE